MPDRSAEIEAARAALREAEARAIAAARAAVDAAERVEQDAARALEDARRAHPLAFATLWRPHCRACGVPMQCGTECEPQHECPECGTVEARTCQRCAVDVALQPHVRVAFILGGNRTGKSEGAAQMDAAVAMGRNHPDVQTWARANCLDLSRLPEGPGVVWSIGLTSGDSRAYIRPKVKRYLPPDWRWLNEFGNGVSTATPDAWKSGDPAIVWFKSVDQGRRAMQGEACDLIRFDEEPEDYEVVKECRQRLIDRHGLMVFSMTPLRGWTALLREFVDNPPGDVVVRYLSALDNPHIDRAEVEAVLRRATVAEREARIKGKIAPLEGSVHPDFDRALHVVPAFAPPADWPRFGGIDFGTRDPFVHLWFALDRSDDVLHVYREHYQPEATLRTHAGAIYDAEHCPDCEPMPRWEDKWWTWQAACADGSHRCGTCNGTGQREPAPEIRWADPANLDSRLTLNGDYGLATTPATKDRRVTLEALCDRLSLDAEGRPHILIHDCCVNTIREIENLTWNERSARELETKGQDHAWDVLRYVCRGLQLAGYSQDTIGERTTQEDR